MAKNITLMGADYPQVPAVQLPQTGGGTATFYDFEHAVITGEFATSAGFKEIDYPTGYTKTNTIVLTLNVYNGNTWRYGIGTQGAVGSDRTFVDLATAKIRVYTSESALLGNEFRIVIMKI